MKKPFLIVVAVFFYAMPSFSQSSKILEANTPINIDGVELGFRIVDESTKASGKEEFARYKIVIFANNNGCPRFFRNEESYGSYTYSSTINLIASFYFRNANGKRFTSKEGKLTAKEWWIPIKVVEKNSQGKDETRMKSMMAGYLFKNGDHLESDFIVLVPLGEKPVVEVVLANNNPRF